MKTNKLLLLAVAVVAVGIFALPSTVSLFAGQHVWYNISGPGNNLPCEKCHADIFEEYTMDANGVHKTLAGGTGAKSWQLGTGAEPRRACGACHRVSSVGTFASGDGSGSTPGEEAHAAATIACMACHNAHNLSGTGWNAPYAGGFKEMNASGQNLSKWQYSKPGHNGTYAAHNAFIIEALKDDTLQDANEACLACHTNIAVKINWTHARSLEWDIDIGKPQTTSFGVHNWTMSNWSTNGTARATVWGNTTGNGSTSYHSNWPGNVDNIYS